jgi:type IV secretory pathway VirB10-like protein
VAIAEKPILDPEQSKPGIPLKRSTVAVMVMLCLTFGFVSSLVFSGDVTPNAPTPVVKDAKELRQLGTSQALKDEEEEAAKVASRAASAPTGRPAPAGPIPEKVRRTDNSAAFADNKLAKAVSTQDPQPQGRDRDLEHEAATRLAKALLHDFDDARQAPEVGPTQRSLQTQARTLGAAEDGSAGAAAPSAALAPQIEAFKKQLMQQASGKADGNWLKDYEQEGAGGRKFISGYHLPKGLVLRQGKVIPAVLGRQINSDLPGRITAYVSSNVYDPDGNLLIPMGAALVGKYDSGVKVGQSRLMFAFERLILPSGYSFDLPAAQGSDLAGAAGMTGDVNNHFFKMFGTSLLIAVLADKGKQPQSVTQVGSSGPTTAAGQVLSDVSKTILERNRVIPPTITVDQGTRINVEVVADMVFPENYRAR